MAAGSALRSARYRAGQVRAALRPRLSAGDLALVRDTLGPAEMALFTAMVPSDRAHAVRTLRAVEAIAAEHGAGAAPALRRAALLHDCGKGSIATWQRVAFVLLERAPGRVRAWVEREEGAAWRRALWRLRHHAALGAELVRRADADPRVVDLVARHGRAAGDDRDLAWLNLADGRS